MRYRRLALFPGVTMNRPLLAATACLMLLSGCGGFAQSSFNPFNWFGRSTEQGPATLVPPGGFAADRDFRVPVVTVTEMALERRPGGAILRASGLPPTQGWWDAELRPENDERPVNGVLTYTFVVAEPRTPQPQGTPQSREVTAARFLPDERLSGVREVRVIGAQNSRVARR